MTAAELIKQVAELPPHERTLFEKLFEALSNGSRAPGSVTPPKWPDFDERLRGIYGDKVAPDSRNLIEVGRGDH